MKYTVDTEEKTLILHKSENQEDYALEIALKKYYTAKGYKVDISEELTLKTTDLNGITWTSTSSTYTSYKMGYIDFSSTSGTIVYDPSRIATTVTTT